MPSKRALIVDDSKTAQFKLIRTLDSYDLIIDTALSAEDALSYLSYQIPDVIFMDHSMKGMSGLDAVKIIKSNPATATIPVVMYTAQSGEVYLSQARAIGAIEVLSKDVMTQTDIQRVMSSLKIGGKRAQVELPRREVRPQLPQQANQVDLVKIRDQVASSLDIQQSQLRRELQDNTRLLVNRFMREIRGLRDDMDKQKKLDRELLTMNLEQADEKRWYDIGPWWFGAFGALSMGLVWAVWSLNLAHTTSDELGEKNRALALKIETQKQEFEHRSDEMAARAKSSGDLRTDKLLNALVWAINQKGQFEFSEPALGENRVPLISGLLEQLTAIEFDGTLTLDVHNGDFCVVRGADGDLALPEAPVAVTRCDFLSDSSFNFDHTSQTSLAFVNMLQSYPIVASGDLRIEIKTHGVSKPASRYPDYAENVTSTQWNAVAQENNRVSISLQN